MKSVFKFFKKETVLSVAIVIAGISCFFVRPDRLYFGYIDYRTLSLLFSLMAVMAGFQAQGVFFNIGNLLLSKVKNIRQIVLVLVLLCFFCSMVITNDVALITFVPFTFVVLDLLDNKLRHEWVLPVVCMQTVAANLGSMLTPIGNPQNLYLYGKSGIRLPEFIKLMVPYTVASLVLIILWITVICSKKSCTAENKLNLEMWQTCEYSSGKVLMYIILFLFCLLTVAHILPYQFLICIVVITLLFLDRATFKKVDYSLLFTFIAFFVFIGNIGRINLFSEWLCTVIDGKEVPVAVLASQIISNVPAALLLSGFTNHTSDLIVGTNLGGLGTLIASMASLISYRQIAKHEPLRKGRYLILFTVSNIVVLAILLCLWRIAAAM